MNLLGLLKKGSKGKAPASAVPEELKAPANHKNIVTRLPYAEPEDGIVFLRGGEKVWYGIELTCPTALSVSELHAYSISEGIRVLLNQGVAQGNGGRLFIERTPAQKRIVDHFYENSPISTDRLLGAMQTKERDDVYDARLHGEITVTRYFYTGYITVPKKPTNLALTEEEYKGQLFKARQERMGLFNRFNGLGFAPSIMSNVEVKRLMWRYLNGNMASADPPAFSSQVDLRGLDLEQVKKDRSMAAQTTRYEVSCTEIGTSNPGWLTMEDKLVSVVCLGASGSSTPPMVINEILEQLQQEHFYLILDFEHLRQGDTQAKLDTAISELKGFLDSPIAKIGANTAAKYETGMQARNDAEANKRHFWRLGLTTVVYAGSRQHLHELNEKVRSLYATINGAHAFVSNEQLKANFFQVMPFSSELTRHRVSAMCTNVASLFPKVSPWFGTDNPVMTLRNRHGSLTGLNFKEGSTNSGMMTIGQSGGGKSVWNMNIMLAYVPLGAKAFAMDPKHDYDEVIYSLGGQIITISPEAKLPDGRPVRINIFDPTPGEMMPGSAKISFIMAVFRVLGIVQSSIDAAVIAAALSNFFLAHSKIVDVPGMDEPQSVYYGGRLKQFVASLSSLNQIGDEGISNKPEFLEARNRMTGLLQGYIAGNGGLLADFLDGETTVEINADCIGFDVEKMLHGDDPVQQALAILLTGEFIFQQCAKSPGTKVGIFEELGVLAGIPELNTLVNRWFKTGRSMGMIPIGTSQEARDFEKLGGLINNSSWIVMTALGIKEIEAIRENVGLPDHVLNLASSLRMNPGVYGEYLVIQKTTEGFYVGDVVRLYLTPEKLWTVTTKKEQKDVRAKYTQDLGSRTEAILELAAMTRRRSAR